MSFVARYSGDCADCDEPIVPGHDVTYDRHSNLVHVRCPQPPDDVPPEPLCGRCFCYHVGEC